MGVRTNPAERNAARAGNHHRLAERRHVHRNDAARWKRRTAVERPSKRSGALVQRASARKSRDRGELFRRTPGQSDRRRESGSRQRLLYDDGAPHERGASGAGCDSAGSGKSADSCSASASGADACRRSPCSASRASVPAACSRCGSTSTGPSRTDTGPSAATGCASLSATSSRAHPVSTGPNRADTGRTAAGPVPSCSSSRARFAGSG